MGAPEGSGIRAAAPRQSSYDSPLPAQQPFGADEAENQQKDDWHVPKVLGLARRDPGIRIRNLAGQARNIRRPPVAPASLARELLEQSAILFRMETLRDAVDTLERQHVPADLLVAILSDDFTRIGARLFCCEFALEHARSVGILRQRHGHRNSLRAQNVRLNLGVRQRLVVLVAYLGGELHATIIVENRAWQRCDYWTRRIRHQPAE